MGLDRLYNKANANSLWGPRWHPLVFERCAKCHIMSSLCAKWSSLTVGVID